VALALLLAVTDLVERKGALKNKHLSCRVEIPEPVVVVALWQQGRKLAVLGILGIKSRGAISLPQYSWG